MNKYSDIEITENLESVSGWKYDNGYLTKTFTFKNFNQAFGFMAGVALIAEKLNHHPDWSGGYKHVTINLMSHDADGITEKDFSFAIHVERLFQ